MQARRHAGTQARRHGRTDGRTEKRASKRGERRLFDTVTQNWFLQEPEPEAKSEAKPEEKAQFSFKLACSGVRDRDVQAGKQLSWPDGRTDGETRKQARGEETF